LSWGCGEECVKLFLGLLGLRAKNNNGRIKEERGESSGGKGKGPFSKNTTLFLGV